METRKLGWSLLLAGAVVTAACGDSMSSLNPTAPSAVSAPAGALSDGTAAVAGPGSAGRGASNGNGNNGNGNNGNGNNGNGNGNGGPPSNTPGNGGPPSNTSPNAPKVEIEGLITSVGANSIVINGETVLVTAETVIRHGNRVFELSDLHKGDRVHVRALRLTGLTASLQAVEIMLQLAGEGGDGEISVPADFVSVTATDPEASEKPTATGPDTGTFRLTRTGSATLLAAPLTVTFTLTGTATNGADYSSLPVTATFAAGASTVDVVVTPLADTLAEPEESVILTLTNVAPYAFGSPVSATVNISLPKVNVIALDAAASETGGNTGTFRLTRTGDTSKYLNVTVKFTGTATNGNDYFTLSTTVHFSEGQSTFDLVVVPIADQAADPSETVILTIVDTAAYDLGASTTATITITGT